MKGWWKRKGVVVTHLAFQPASLPRPSGPRLLILVLPTSGRTAGWSGMFFGRMGRWSNGSVRNRSISSIWRLWGLTPLWCVWSRITIVLEPPLSELLALTFWKLRSEQKKGLTYLPDMCLIWLVLIWLYMLLHGLDPDPLLGVEATGPLGATAGCGRHPSWCMGDQETLHTFFEAIGVGQP